MRKFTAADTELARRYGIIEGDEERPISSP
jgi:hypothetical protein